jgi:hypothetical protein
MGHNFSREASFRQAWHSLCNQGLQGTAKETKMPIFTEHLRKESDVIQFALSQLAKSLREIFESGSPNIQDLRVITYSLRLLFKRSHVTKLETLLYPELDPSQLDEDGFEKFSEQTEKLYNDRARLQLLRLQLALDGFGERSSRDELARCVDDCVHMIGHVLDHERDVILPLADKVIGLDRQNELYMKVIELDRKQALERVQATQALMNMDLARASGN